MSARAVGRLSAQANGIRFGAVQRHEDAFRAELRALRREASAEGSDLAAITTRLQALREQVERFAGQWLAPPPPQVATDAMPTAVPATDTSAPQAAAPAPLAVQQVAAIRQGVTRAMIALAQAPLHLRIEFGTGFVEPNPEPLLLAARMHAIHRGVRGSLKQVCWQSPDRAELAFGDGVPGHTVDAVFDAAGRLQVPDAVRQQPGRAAAPAAESNRGRRTEGTGVPAGAAADRRQAGRGPRPQSGQAGQPRQGAPSGRPQQDTTRGRAPTPEGGRTLDARAEPRPDGGDRSSVQRRPGPGGPGRRNGPPAPQPQRVPATHARPRQAADGTRRPGPASPGGATPAGDDRRTSRPRAPINPLMADKLRAVLAGASGAKPATATAATDPSAPAPEGPGAPKTGTSD